MRVISGSRELDEKVQIFLDSPLAINATSIYASYVECFDDKAKNGFSAHADQRVLLGWLERFKSSPDVYLVHGGCKKNGSLF